MKNCLKKQKMCLLSLVIKKKLLTTKNLVLREKKKLSFDFRGYRSLKELSEAIYYRNLSIDKTDRIQDEYEAQFAALEKYEPKTSDYATARKNLLINAKNFYDGREMIINAFKDKIFPLSPEDFFENEDEDEDLLTKISTKT